MRQLQHFFIEEDLNQDRLTIRDRELLHQMRNVLRFRAGDSVVLLDGKGIKAQATVELIHQKEAVLNIQSKERFSPPARTLRLYVALPKKPATLEWIVEKATELGVSEIIPLSTERCQVHELKKPERLKLIIKEAAEQCERVFIPELKSVLKLSELVNTFPSGQVLVGDPWIYDTVLSKVEKSREINVVIGPEGGLSERELTALKEAGATLFQLGDLVLRMETAVVAALSVVQFA